MTLFDAPTLLTYTVAVVALIAAPGPAQALVIARSLQGGTRAGLLTMVGLHVGTLVHTFAAAVGLSAVLASSATAFAVIKYVGALYLVVLGVTTLRRLRESAKTESPSNASAVSDAKLIAHAAATGVLNPKVAIFFLAFLPQFVHPDRGHVLLQFLTLGGIFIVIGMLGDGLVTCIATFARSRVKASERWRLWRETLVGTVLIALGIRLALVQKQ